MAITHINFIRGRLKMEDIEKINVLQANVTALQMAVKVLYAYAPQQAKDDLKSMGDEVLDRLLSAPVPDAHLELLAQSLRAIHRK